MEKAFKLNTGIVLAAGYARKITRTMFAQLKSEISSNSIDVVEVKKAIGEINQLLYKILVEKLRVDKTDAVRITINYAIESGKIRFYWDTLSIEVYRRISEDHVKMALREIFEGPLKENNFDVGEASD